MATIVWIALAALAVTVITVVVWWIKASRKRCPIDGSIRCRHCRYEEDDGPVR